MPRTPIDKGRLEPPAAVGPGRPPEQHRIRDGEIRNPWGRRGKPKAPVDFLDETVVVRVDGEPRHLTRDEALDYLLFGKAAKGDVRAIQTLEERARRRRGQTTDPAAVELSDEERAAFDRFISRAAKCLAPEDPV